MIPSPRILALCLAVVFSASAVAADIPKPPDSNRVRGDVTKMRSGTIRVKDPDDKSSWEKNQKAVDTVAQWLAYRIATPPYNGEPVPVDPKGLPPSKETMDDLMGDAHFFTTLSPPSGNQGKLTVEQIEYGMIMGNAIAKAAKVVLDNSARPIERINAVRLMSVAARMPCGDLANYFIEIIGNAKTSDAEKVYAFEGVKNLMEQTDIVDPAKHVIRDVNQLGKLAKALSDYITQDRQPKDEREMHVIEFVRRHAVSALAVLKDGVYRKPTGELIFRPSWTLMRVIASDPNVSPPFTIQEKAEAIIGFCQMKNDPEMNLDVAAYMIAVAPVPSASGTTLGGLVEFARSANEDVLRAKRDGTLPSVHWKVAAARMSLALANWREFAKTQAKTRYPDTIITLANQGISLLTPLEKEGGGASTGAEVQAVTQFATNNAPKAWSASPPEAARLYKDDPNSVLPFAAPAKKSPKLATPTAPMTPPTKGPDPKAADPKKEPPKK
jgi:hypothetical protein